MTRLELTGVTKKYGRGTAVDDLTFAPVPGRVTGFVGNNGAGKSTALRILLGLTRPTAGSATIDGGSYGDLPHPLRTIGALVDPNVFHPGRSGRNALRVLGRAAEIPDRRVDEGLGLGALAGAAGGRGGGAPRTPGVDGSARPRWACASASRLPPRCWAIRPRWCSTSPPTAWTRT